MGGTIGVTSEFGKGSCFFFDVILEYDQKCTKGMIYPQSMKNLKVLIIDDNEESRKIVGKILETFRFEIFEADSGKAGIELLKKEKVDLVILDYLMPELNGIETAQLINELDVQKKVSNIMMISAYGRDEIKKEAEICGIHHFIDKPVNPSYLYDCIMDLFGEKRTKQVYTDERLDGRAEKLRQIRGAKVLLVEDNEINQQVATEILESEGFCVYVAGNGAEAVEMLEKTAAGEYDLIFMDVQMPVMDGREATRLIRKMETTKKDIPIIALTAHAFVEEKEINLASGMNDQINKPIEATQLIEVLTKYIKPKSEGGIFLEDGVFESSAEETSQKGIRIVIPGIDTEDGLNRVVGNLVLYRELLQSFIKKYGEAAKIIQEHQMNREFKQCEILVHTIKGTAGNLGAMELYRAAGELEKACRDQIEDEEKQSCFEKELILVNAGIAKYFENETAETIPAATEATVDLDQLNDSFVLLAQELEGFSADALMMAKELNLKLPLKARARFAPILDQINELQFMEAKQELIKFLEKFEEDMRKNDEE